MSTTRSKPIENPVAGTSRPSRRPIMPSYRPPPAMEPAAKLDERISKIGPV